jgi:hypothetical protein
MATLSARDVLPRSTFLGNIKPSNKKLGLKSIIEDRRLHCPSNVIWPFKYTPLSKTTLQNATPN